MVEELELEEMVEESEAEDEEEELCWVLFNPVESSSFKIVELSVIITFSLCTGPFLGTDTSRGSDRP
ncbi:hypothetical protein WICPIJ_009003 [Wickerhamomyces pijperi]|uniref:Uncharacterized protein n=1 Tax=Wickerhamomyces pijperi TaxID=599730 RepID=A0A9P8PS35_WICPI|nr:hypothetical protein WICPIJ_009003 [Wickerhamomyces pijperi]